uniref:RanBP2-type domain-containing protein n=1 Tax=Chromera velia CCMP2878 TaxID=1169474 RepID=A0A0G4F7L6_9ALVE|eukprot:Cvel_15580.t1-p1 / transcript=Cvel_15580.t1 / gene=Cvel_15580 / organism=Chromera_velia_CCMP2878 / gene_product=hypothetical protein / transcript_product=hypothetical protein / location=Cvel_scaffold1158:45916-50692(-) / protein_length=1225 / sequence_SO=supercontig / SO=protein_coding / is_pseudo=false
MQLPLAEEVKPLHPLLEVLRRESTSFSRFSSASTTESRSESEAAPCLDLEVLTEIDAPVLDYVQTALEKWRVEDESEKSEILDICLSFIPPFREVSDPLPLMSSLRERLLERKLRGDSEQLATATAAAGVTLQQQQQQKSFGLCSAWGLEESPPTRQPSALSSSRVHCTSGGGVGCRCCAPWLSGGNIGTAEKGGEPDEKVRGQEDCDQALPPTALEDQRGNPDQTRTQQASMQVHDPQSSDLCLPLKDFSEGPRLFLAPMPPSSWSGSGGGGTGGVCSGLPPSLQNGNRWCSKNVGPVSTASVVVVSPGCVPGSRALSRHGTAERPPSRGRSSPPESPLTVIHESSAGRGERERGGQKAPPPSRGGGCARAQTQDDSAAGARSHQGQSVVVAEKRRRARLDRLATVLSGENRFAALLLEEACGEEEEEEDAESGCGSERECLHGGFLEFCLPAEGDSVFDESSEGDAAERESCAEGESDEVLRENDREREQHGAFAVNRSQSLFFSNPTKEPKQATPHAGEEGGENETVLSPSLSVSAVSAPPASSSQPANSSVGSTRRRQATLFHLGLPLPSIPSRQPHFPSSSSSASGHRQRFRGTKTNMNIPRPPRSVQNAEMRVKPHLPSLPPVQPHLPTSPHLVPPSTAPAPSTAGLSSSKGLCAGGTLTATQSPCLTFSRDESLSNRPTFLQSSRQPPKPLTSSFYETPASGPTAPPSARSLSLSCAVTAGAGGLGWSSSSALHQISFPPSTCPPSGDSPSGAFASPSSVSVSASLCLSCGCIDERDGRGRGIVSLRDGEGADGATPALSVSQQSAEGELGGLREAPPLMLSPPLLGSARWLCGVCGEGNAATFCICENCGEPKEGSGRTAPESHRPPLALSVAMRRSVESLRRETSDGQRGNPCIRPGGMGMKRRETARETLRVQRLGTESETERERRLDSNRWPSGGTKGSGLFPRFPLSLTVPLDPSPPLTATQLQRPQKDLPAPPSPTHSPAVSPRLLVEGSEAENTNRGDVPSLCARKAAAIILDIARTQREDATLEDSDSECLGGEENHPAGGTHPPPAPRHPNHPRQRHGIPRRSPLRSSDKTSVSTAALGGFGKERGSRRRTQKRERHVRKRHEEEEEQAERHQAGGVGGHRNGGAHMEGGRGALRLPPLLRGLPMFPPPVVEGVGAGGPRFPLRHSTDRDGGLDHTYVRVNIVNERFRGSKGREKEKNRSGIASLRASR